MVTSQSNHGNRGVFHRSSMDLMNAMSCPSHLRFTLLALVFLTSLSLTNLSAAQDAARDYDKSPNQDVEASGITYSTTVSEVRVTFFATDQNNHLQESLTKSDFAVVDNDRVIRNFRSCTRASETMLDVAALLDLSESVGPHFRDAIANVLQLIAREKSFPENNLAVLSFGGGGGGMSGAAEEATPAAAFRQTSGSIKPAILCSRGCPVAGSIAKLQAVKSGGLTPLYDALIFASDFLGEHHAESERNGARDEPPGSSRQNVRPVIILFSDGNDTISLHNAGDALQAARDAGILIYSVDIGASERSSGGHFMQQVANATGGRYFSPRFVQNGSAASLLNTVLEDARASYVVTYDLPDEEARFHSLRVLPTHNLNLTFHSRDSYTYEPRTVPR